MKVRPEVRDDRTANRQARQAWSQVRKDERARSRKPTATRKPAAIGRSSRRGGRPRKKPGLWQVAKRELFYAGRQMLTGQKPRRTWKTKWRRRKKIVARLVGSTALAWLALAIVFTPVVASLAIGGTSVAAGGLWMARRPAIRRKIVNLSHGPVQVEGHTNDGRQVRSYTRRRPT